MKQLFIIPNFVHTVKRNGSYTNYRAKRYNTIQNDTIRYNSITYDTIQYKTIQNDTIYNIIQLKSHKVNT